MTLWDRLTAFQDGGVYPLWPVAGPNGRDHLAAWSRTRRAEIKGFLRGLDAGGTDPERMASKAAEAIRVIAETDMFYENYERLAREDPVDRGVPEAMQHVKNLDEVLQGCISAIMVGQKELRAQKIKQIPQATPIGRPFVGRNDPCPCGSGKKFKKCCGMGTTKI